MVSFKSAPSSAISSGVVKRWRYNCKNLDDVKFESTLKSKQMGEIHLAFPKMIYRHTLIDQPAIYQH